ncbi:DUF368 domain-containing protein [Salinibius halmophilus]|uniref:DUF368 domain-containing protein n=1 Tax=Salinibius halmophilus TaxID=1853216 RepID=UPI000E676632|nr:DUF368 domain-containing protein [Salinibius halmophilus]
MQNSWWMRLLKGSLIGIADPIPGVSGGTVAYLTGMYDEIIARTSGFFSHPDGWRVNFLFLLPIVVGLLAGIFGFAHLLVWLLEHYPVQTQQGFVGLVAGSLISLVWQGKLVPSQGSSIAALVVAALIAFAFSIIPRPELTEAIISPVGGQWLFIFVAGIVAAATMLIPGISGSMLQLLIGSYATYITAVKTLNWPVVLVFFAGAIIGIVAAAKIMNTLFNKFYQAMQALIGGLVVGSIIVLWPWQQDLGTQGLGLLIAFVMAGVPLALQGRRAQ